MRFWWKTTKHLKINFPVLYWVSLRYAVWLTSPCTQVHVHVPVSCACTCACAIVEVPVPSQCTGSENLNFMASTLIPRKPQLIGVLACIYIVMFFSVIYIRGHEWTNVGTPVSSSAWEDWFVLFVTVCKPPPNVPSVFPCAYLWTISERRWPYKYHE